MITLDLILGVIILRLCSNFGGKYIALVRPKICGKLIPTLKCAKNANRTGPRVKYAENAEKVDALIPLYPLHLLSP